MPATRNDKGQYAKASTNGDGRPTLNQLINKAQRLMGDVRNAQMSRASFSRRDDFDPRRSINHDCGYPDTENINVLDYKEMYTRNPIATRVVQILPRESWQVQPVVSDTDDPGESTPFADDWSVLGDNFQGKSWHKKEDGHPVFEYLSRVDQESGIGSYGVLLLGLDDGEELSKPAAPKEGQQLTFLRVFDRTMVDIASFEKDKTNERFGKPTMYSLKLQDTNDTPGGEMEFMPGGSHQVHWTRIIHIADNLGSSELYGVPRQRPVWNRLLDCRKLYGGSAEMYWRGALPGYSLETHPQLGADVSFDVEATKDQIEQFINTLQRWIAVPGAHVNSLAPQVVDPTAQVDVQIEAICIQGGYPKRVFTGSERGELASSQDTIRWNGRLQQRQTNYITPRIIVPFVDRLIWLGVLSEPAVEGYSVVWPDLTELSAAEQAEIAAKQTEAMAKYVQGNVDMIVTPVDFLVKFLGKPQSEAEEMMSAAAEQEPLIEEEKDEPAFPPGGPSDGKDEASETE